MKFPNVTPDIDYVEFFSGSGNLARAVRETSTSSAKYGVGPCSGRTDPLISFFHSLFLFVSLSLSPSPPHSLWVSTIARPWGESLFGPADSSGKLSEFRRRSTGYVVETFDKLADPVHQNINTDEGCDQVIVRTNN